VKEIIRQKQETVDAICADFNDSLSVVLLDYRGITVADFTALRANCRKQNVTVRVLKNTLVNRACEKLGIEGLEPSLHGPTAVFFSKDDPAAAPKLLREFMLKNRKVSVKAGVVGTSTLDAAGAIALADLPSKEALVAKMLGSMQAPIAGFVGVLSGVPRALVCALNAVREQKAG